MKITFVGDVMPGGLLTQTTDFISSCLLNHLAEADLRAGTLETAIGDGLEFDRTKMKGRKNIIWCRNEDFWRVKQLGLDVVSLANNHLFDLGVEGLKNALRLLDDAGISHLGAGMSAEEAARPVYRKVGDKTVGFLAYCQFGTKYIGHVPVATESTPGINPLTIEKLKAEIPEVRKNADYVVVMPHWGIEFQHLPTPECRLLAELMISLGADAVMGSHPHQVQPLAWINHRPVAFSMGNFLFPDFFMAPPRPLCYPSREEIDKGYSIAENYPFLVETLTKQQWRHQSRIGMMVDVTFNEKVSADFEITYMDLNNRIDFYRNTSVECRKRAKRKIFRLRHYAKFLESNHYGMLYRIYNAKLCLPRRAFHFVTRKLHLQ